jgi:predicted nucleotidyltransferase
MLRRRDHDRRAARWYDLDDEEQRTGRDQATCPEDVMATTTDARTDPLVADIVRRLVTALRPERVYLFGSRARGDASDASDYDVMVVVAASSVPRHQREQVAYQALWGLGVPVDVVVLTRDEFERQSTVVASLPATVEREGTLVYAA